MAGRPRVHAARIELETRAREMRAEGHADATELDYAVDWCLNGGTLASLAVDISRYSSVDVERSQILIVLHELFGRAEVTQRINDARPASAHVLVEQAIAIADKLDDREINREDVARAKLQADVRTWAAQRWNPKELGEGKGAGVTINVNSLHLDALRAANGYERPYEIQPAPVGQLDAGAQSTRALGPAQAAHVTVVKEKKSKKVKSAVTASVTAGSAVTAERGTRVSSHARVP